MQAAAEDARGNIGRAKRHQKQFFDRGSTAVPRYSVGDLVWLHYPVVPQGSSAKLTRPWIGPFRVTRVLSDLNVEIRRLGGNRRRQVVHVNRVKPCPRDIRLEGGLDRVEWPEELRDEEDPLIQARTCRRRLKRLCYRTHRRARNYHGGRGFGHLG